MIVALVLVTDGEGIALGSDVHGTEVHTISVRVVGTVLVVGIGQGQEIVPEEEKVRGKAHLVIFHESGSGKGSEEEIGPLNEGALEEVIADPVSAESGAHLL